MATNLVEYIRTDGSQYFDTGIVLKDNTKVTMSVRKATQTVTWDAYYIWLGQKTTSDTNGGANGRNIMIRNNSSLSTSSLQVLFSGGSTTSSATYSGLNTVGGDFKKLSIEAGRFEGASTVSLTSTSILNDGNIWILGGYGSGRHIAADIQSILIEEGDETVAELLPAKYNDEACLYDTVSGEFISAKYSGNYTSLTNPVQAGQDSGPIDGYPYSNIAITYSGDPATKEATTQELSLNYYTNYLSSWHLDTTTPLPQWLTVSPTSGGSGTTVITLSFSENTGSTSRSHTLTFTDGSKTATVTANQMRNVTTYDYVEFTGETSSSWGNQLTFPFSGVTAVRMHYYSMVPANRLSNNNTKRTVFCSGNARWTVFGVGGTSLFGQATFSTGSYSSTTAPVGNSDNTQARVEVKDVVIRSGGRVTIGEYGIGNSTTFASNFDVFLNNPNKGTRLGRITFLNSNGETLHDVFPAYDTNGDEAYYDAIGDTFYTFNDPNSYISVGSFPAVTQKTYTLDAIVTEAQDIALREVTLNRVQSGVSTPLIPTYDSGGYNARRYTATDTVTGEAEWDWRAEDIYGSYGTATVDTYVNGVPDRFWIRNDSDSTAVLTASKNSGSGNATLNWSTDGITWGSTASVEMPPHTKVYLTMSDASTKNSDKSLKLSDNTRFSTGGDARTFNIGHLLGVVDGVCSFQYMFQNAAYLIDAHELYFGYRIAHTNMLNYAFYGCTNLVSPPPLNDIMRLYSQGQYIFNMCNSLVNPPTFSSLCVVENVYRMFMSCPSIQGGVDLSHTGTVTGTSQNPLEQFYSSTPTVQRMTTPRVAPNENTNNIYNGWTQNVGSTGTVRVSMPMDLPTGSVSGIPSGWSRSNDNTWLKPTTRVKGATYIVTQWAASLDNNVSGMRIRWTKSDNDSPIYSVNIKAKNRGLYYITDLEPSTDYIIMYDVMLNGQWQLMTGYLETTTAYTADYPKVVNLSDETMTVTATDWHWEFGGTIKYRAYGASTWSTKAYTAGQTITLTIVPAGQIYEFCFDGLSEAVFTITADKEHAYFGNFNLLGSTCNTLFASDTYLYDAKGIYWADSNGYLTTAPLVLCNVMFGSCYNLLNTPDMSHFVTAEGSAFFGMFRSCTSLKNGADFSNVENCQCCVFGDMYIGCTELQVGSDIRKAVNWSDIAQFTGMYSGCSKLREAWTPNIQAWDNDRFSGWLNNVAAIGVLHAPANLTIPTGSGGIPSSWTRENY